ncbi:MAG: SNF2-related protein, partial [bacterium]
MNVRKYVPREYQKLAADLIIKLKGSLIILDMGLGKTVATLTAIDYLMYDSYEINKVLIIAPKKVAESVWDAEAAKWEHLRYLKIAKILGSAKERLNSLKQKADIYIINVDNFIWLNDLFGQNWPFDMVVVDESSLFKSHQA